MYSNRYPSYFFARMNAVKPSGVVSIVALRHMIFLEMRFLEEHYIRFRFIHEIQDLD